MMGLQIFFKIAQSAIFALLLIGCAHSVSPEGSQQDTSVVQQPSTALWHDGSTGGLYGIGLGWRIELLPAEYETVTETIIIGPLAIDFIVVPAEREWVKHDGEDLGSGPIMETRLVMLPAEYEMAPETVVVEPSRIEYYVTDAVYGSAGDIITPKTVKQRTIQAVTKQQERRVVKVPTRTEKRLVPVERRKGYRRFVKTEAYVKEFALPTKPKMLSRKIVKQPYQFVIRNPDGETANVFDDFDDITAFVDSLN